MTRLGSEISRMEKRKALFREVPGNVFWGFDDEEREPGADLNGAADSVESCALVGMLLHGEVARRSPE